MTKTADLNMAVFEDFSFKGDIKDSPNLELGFNFYLESC